MKIAFLHFWTFRLRRGVETLVVSLANELSKRNLDVSIVTARQTQTPLITPSPQVRVKQFPTFRYYEFVTIVPFYAFDLLREQYDVVVTFFADFGEGAALRAASLRNRSRLFLYLTFPYHGAPHRYSAYRQWGWDKSAAHILADAEFTARVGEEFFHRPISVLPSGTDPRRFFPNAERRAALRRAFGFADHDVVLLNVAALERRKGAWRVIEALPQLRERCPNLRYLILGDGDERANLQRRVEELGLTRNVIFAGTTTELPAFYNAADIFVMLPDAEAGSIACLEAMASGLPVVVSNTGGFAEAVNSQTGRIADLNNPGTIVEQIAELARDEDLRQNLGAAGRQVVIEKFSWERIADKFLNLCRQSAYHE